MMIIELLGKRFLWSWLKKKNFRKSQFSFSKIKIFRWISLMNDLQNDFSRLSETFPRWERRDFANRWELWGGSWVMRFYLNGRGVKSAPASTFSTTLNP